MLDNVGLRYPHRASGTKAPRTLRPLPLLRFAVSATGGAHLCSTKYYLRFWLSSCRTSLAVSALRIVRYCLNIVNRKTRALGIAGKRGFYVVWRADGVFDPSGRGLPRSGWGELWMEGSLPPSALTRRRLPHRGRLLVDVMILSFAAPYPVPRLRRRGCGCSVCLRQTASARPGQAGPPAPACRPDPA